MLRYFFKYYDDFVDRYVFFDDGSTDQTLNILRNHPKVEIRPYELLNADSFVLSARELNNNIWKESRGIADWVITITVDEFLYTPNLKSYLYRCTEEGVTAIPALGFQMISKTRPSSNQNLPDIVKRGAPWEMMNKLCIFNPNKIIEVNQHIGRHRAEPTGKVKYPVTDELLLLHYRYLSFEHTFNRNSDLQKKLGSLDKKKGWGHKYGWAREQLKTDWEYFEKNSIEDVLAPEYNPHILHSSMSKRWWRKSKTNPIHVAENPCGKLKLGGQKTSFRNILHGLRDFFSVSNNKTN